MLHILACNGEMTIDQANEITLTYTHTTHLYRAYSSGDFCRLDIISRFSHRLAVCGEVGLEIEAGHGGNTLGHRIGRNNVDLFAGEIDDLARAQDNIAIGGQDEHLVGCPSLYRCQ